MDEGKANISSSHITATRIPARQDLYAILGAFDAVSSLQTPPLSFTWFVSRTFKTDPQQSVIVLTVTSNTKQSGALVLYQESHQWPAPRFKQPFWTQNCKVMRVKLPVIF